MKQILIKVVLPILLMLGGVNSVLAQSTYTWDATKWSAVCGSINVTDGKIVGTDYQWGCIQVKITSSFKLPKRQTFLVIKGENLFNDSNNPNVFDINGNNPGLKGFTINSAKTLAYIDITSKLPEKTDFFGNVTINSFGITIDQDGENPTAMPTINSIEFVAADLIDVMTITSNGNVSSISQKSPEGEFKKTLSFTINVDKNDIGLEVSGGTQQLNSSDMFLVIETDNTALNTNSRMKLRSMTAGGSKYENNTGGGYIVNRELANGHRLYVHSFYKGTDTSGSLLQQWTENQTMDITQATLYINSNDQNGTTVNIYRLGFYNLSEIMNMYNLSGEHWWYVRSQEGTLDVEIHGSAPANWIKINNADASANTNTAAYGAQIIRSMGVLPSNFTGIEFRKLSFVTDNQPLTFDIFADLPDNITTIFLSPDEYWHFPTMKTCVKVAGYAYKQFKEGTAPGLAPDPITDGGGSKFTSLTRKLKAGYNSIVLPFNKLQYGLLPTDVEVFTLSNYNSSTGEVTFGKITSGDTSNNLPAIVYAPTDGLYMFVGRDPVTDFSNNYYAATQGDAKFVGSYVNEVPSGDYSSRTNYGIDATGKLAKMGAETKTTYYRAFLSLPSGAEARLAQFTDDETTGIKTINNVKSTINNVFDLQGRRVATPQKGLYIVNGKKVLIK